ncbi:MAG: GTP 3',8-cyclase MoaA [Firmicutes bacterium]|nr:GTP 3',8-cyclase MoaA [Bacillota bacterium]
MVDSFFRKIDYLRVSITDRCNLRCKYCVSDNFTRYPRQEILQYEEVLRLCTIMARLGVENFRVTGGEPLVRKGCAGFVQNLKAIPGAKNITLTTNGVLINNYIQDLAHARLDGLNISLDSVCKENYKNITGTDAFDSVWQALHKAVEYSIPTKINSVIIKGVNSHEILSIAEIAEKMPVSVRFIELMPTGANKDCKGVPSTEVLQVISAKYGPLTPCGFVNGSGPARYYGSKSLIGKIGFISPINHNFCQSCNRLRVSSTGFLRLCLHHNQGIDLKYLLRCGATDDEIKQAILTAVYEKPQRHFLDSETNLQDMSKIGG